MANSQELSDKIVIIGAGLAGCSTALHVAALRPDLTSRIEILEKTTFPRDKPCGGGLTPLAVALLHSFSPTILEEGTVLITNVLLVAEQHTHNVTLQYPMGVAHRKLLDHRIAKLTQERGVSIRQGCMVTSVERNEEHLTVHADRDYDARIVFGADGAQSIVRPLVTTQRGGLARLIEVITPDRLDQPPELRSTIVFDFTNIHHGLQGYTWRFPCEVDGVPCINWGIFDSRIFEESPRPDLGGLLDDFMSDHGYRGAREAWVSHPVRRFDAGQRVQSKGVALIGDAAGVDPALGEGISLALDYGDLAANAIIEAEGTGDYSLESFHERLLSHAVGRSLQVRNRMARQMYTPGSASPQAALSLMQQWLQYT